MAVLNKPQVEYSPYDLLKFQVNANAPEGIHNAVCVDVLEVPNFVEKAYEGEGTETKDKIAFLFGFIDNDGVQRFVQTFAFNISSSPKSKLIGFIRKWLGEAIPVGFESSQLIGRNATITVFQKTSRQGTKYSTLETITPVVDKQKISSIPNVADFVLHGDRKTAIPAEAYATEQTATTEPGSSPF